ncbi:hypothetical protein [Pseudobacteroides cellulosolvens]|uniref:hypothetical protein n=1 Tax=Pseudobacteroides cellulosolvens TaxID=35825 RepID=UPI00056B320B|nr:hypothetical protein [Pseudobacteroides cellulosolvens]
MGENTPSVRTSEKLAEIHKVNERTIREDGKYAKAVDKIGRNRKVLKHLTLLYHNLKLYFLTYDY